MISDDIILNTFALVKIFSMFAFGVCFFIFVRKILGGAAVGKDSFLFFNYMIFKRSVLSNSSVIIFFLALFAAVVVEFRRRGNDIALLANIAGGVSFPLFAAYGKFFYKGVVADKKPFFFIKVFLTELDFSLGSFFLWLSRCAYLVWIVVSIAW